MLGLLRRLLVGVVVGGVPAVGWAADLPAHGPLRVLIVSDSVNPNMLSDAELTQAGDLEAALEGPATGLNIDSVLEVSSQCVDEALAALAVPTDYTTMIYFAHRSARGCDMVDRQAALTAAVEAFLIAGGGVVVFHHGIYQDAGKEAILQLFGGTAGSIGWDTNVGQNIINVADGHFVTANGVEYTGMLNYADMQHGVPAGDYAYFNNTPDERYPALNVLSLPGETRTILFASDYNNNGATHVIGWDLQRPGWAGRVVFYQPGEWQPQALDDVNGNNFQILANAIVHVSGAGDPPDETTGGEASTGDETMSATGGETAGEASSPGSTGGGDPSGDPSSAGPTGSEPTGGGDPTGLTQSGGPAETTSGEGSTVDGGGTSGGPTGATSTATAASGGETDDGCGCRSHGEAGGLLGLGLLIVRRRRATRVRS